MDGSGSPRTGSPQITLVHPADPARSVTWTGAAFSADDFTARVLAYDAEPSGWSDALTRLHEASGRDDHFIDIASRRDALAQVERAVTHTPSVILEIGTSSGFLLADLRQRFAGHIVMGADQIGETLDALAQRLPDVPLLRFDLQRCPLPDACADVVVLLNVLEHIPDDQAAAAHLLRIVKPGGTVILEVPAGSALYDVYDRVLMHERRYDMPALEALMTDAGFLVERRTHLGFLLFPAFLVAKRINQWRYPAGAAIDDAALVARMIASTGRSSPIMRWLLRIEEALRSVLPLPFGIRCLMTCRRPPEANKYEALQRRAA
jgi:SAM-dependent methyltransferase